LGKGGGGVGESRRYSIRRHWYKGGGTLWTDQNSQGFKKKSAASENEHLRGKIGGTRGLVSGRESCLYGKETGVLVKQSTVRSEKGGGKDVVGISVGPPKFRHGDWH